MHEKKYKTVKELGQLRGVYVLLRSSLNVPVADGKVQDIFRITQALPTMQFLLEQGARVILVSHLGKDGTESIKPVYDELQKHINVRYSPEVIGQVTFSLRNSLEDGQALLLENVRKDEREMNNDALFAQELASLAEVYVNDDFAASHRAHASLEAICSYLPSYAGINFDAEYDQLSKTLTPQAPSLFILGGAKFETKMPLVEKFLVLYDNVFIGGALANDFFKAKGYSVGASLVSDIRLEGSQLLTHPKVLLPVDVVAVRDGVSRVCAPTDITEDESILDAGPQTIALLAPYISNAKTILWNGPLGNYDGGYGTYTIECAKQIAKADGYSVIGGGDTVAAIDSLSNHDQYGFLSTAGGAMLTFLEEGTLPAIEALVKNQK